MAELTGAMRWTEVVQRLASHAPVETDGPRWLCLLWPTPHGPVRVRVDHVVIDGEDLLSVVVGGCAEKHVAWRTVLTLNGGLPPGCSVFLDGGSLWLRYVAPTTRIAPERLVAFAAREGARFTDLAPRILSDQATVQSPWAE